MVKAMSIKEFMGEDFKAKREEKAKAIVKIAGCTLLITFIPDIVFAESAIDRSASQLYDKLLVVGKWIIIIKGGIDTINNVVQGDFNTAKKSFLGYLVVYLVLQGLPWAMNEVDKVFNEMS